MSENQSPTPAAPQRVLQRIRAVYARQEELRYVSHLEMQTVWERTLRRAGAALAYSQGFNPRPRIHMACALPLGFLSRCEIIDFWIDVSPGEVQPEMKILAAQIRAAAPPGLQLLELEDAALDLPALQTQIVSAVYEAAPYDAIDPIWLAQAVAGLLAAESLPRERRNKPYDLRPLIESLEIAPEGPTRLTMQLASRDGATGRPEEVLDALGLDPSAFRVERTALILKDTKVEITETA